MAGRKNSKSTAKSGRGPSGRNAGGGMTPPGRNATNRDEDMWL